MKLWQKTTALVSAVALTFCCLSANVPADNIKITEANAAVDDGNDDWLHTKGNRIYDMYNNEVWLTGANWFGFNCGENVVHGIWSADLRKTLKDIADHGINILRIPISTELLYSWMQGTPNPVSSVTASNDPYFTLNAELANDDGTTKNSMEIFDIMMNMCKDYGIKVMVDVHSPHTDNSGHNYELWYGKEGKTCGVVTTDMWIDTWVWLAEKYKNDDTIVAFDLKNEPHGKRGYTVEEPTNAAKWDNSTDENNWKYAAERCGKAVLDANPNLLIMIEGVEQSPKDGYTWADKDIWQASADVSPWYPAWWGGNLRGVAKYPVNLGSDDYNDQIVYSPHDYGPGVYEQSWFQKDFTTQTLLDDYWYDTWAYINDQNIAPLFMGEWGGFMDGGRNQQWLTLLRDYMIENRINHTFWCINPNSGDTGGLLDSSFAKWDEEKYGLLEPALWQDDKGVYISLDHKTALGDNGQSLSTYYKLSGDETTVTTITTATTEGTTTAETTVTTKPTTTTTSTTTSDSSLDTTTTHTGDIIYGDVNGDGSVGVSDLVMLAKAMIGTIELTDAQKEAADVQYDGKITTADLVKLAQSFIKDTILGPQ